MNNISISESRVNKLLQNINPHKTTGPDEICGRVLTELSTTMSRPVAFKMFHEITSYDVLHDFSEHTG
jgi:hypothetical protein